MASDAPRSGNVERLVFGQSDNYRKRNLILLPVLWNYFKQFVRWPTPEQWLEMANRWEMFPGAVAVIDGMRHAIQRPQTERQQDFYSGYCRYHNFSIPNSNG